MKNWILFFLLALLLPSCASMLNHEYVRMDIHTTAPSTIIHDQDTLQTEINKASLYLQRSKRKVTIIAQADTIQKTLVIKSRLSPAFYLNAFWIYGILIDQRKNRVFEYPPSIQLDMSNSLPIYYSYGVPEKGQLYFNFSIPGINNFLVDPYDWTPPKTGTSYLGIGASFEYYYKQNRFLNLDFQVAGATSLNRDDGRENFGSAYVSFSNNHRIKRWSWGYGLSFGGIYWDKSLKGYDDFGFRTTSFIFKDSKNVGTVFKSYYQLTERFYLGMIYRPSFLEVDPVYQMKYEHLISIDFLFKFRTKR